MITTGNKRNILQKQQRIERICKMLEFIQEPMTKEQASEGLNCTESSLKSLLSDARNLGINYQVIRKTGKVYYHFKGSLIKARNQILEGYDTFASIKSINKANNRASGQSSRIVDGTVCYGFSSWAIISANRQALYNLKDSSYRRPPRPTNLYLKHK